MANTSRKAGSSGGEPFSRRPKNPFQKSGSEEVYKVTETKKACVIRVDMSGCPESDLTYWVDGSNIHFFADEPAMPEYNHPGRKYGGSIVINTEAYNANGAKVKIVNGVLWITVPKIPGVNATIDVTERLLRFQITRP